MEALLEPGDDDKEKGESQAGNPEDASGDGAGVEGSKDGEPEVSVAASALRGSLGYNMPRIRARNAAHRYMPATPNPPHFGRNTIRLHRLGRPGLNKDEGPPARPAA